MYRLRRGIGDWQTLDVTDWSRTAAWWCDKVGWGCSDADVVAARALRNPDVHYPSMPMSAPLPVPSDLRYPQETPQDLSNQQILATQAQNQRYFESISAINDPTRPQCDGAFQDSGGVWHCPFSIPWWAWALGGVAAVAILIPPSGRHR